MDLSSFYKNILFIILIWFPLHSCLALTISKSDTVGVIRTDDPATDTTTFTATSANANILNATITAALSSHHVKIKDDVSPDIILNEGTNLEWGSPYNLTINAPRNVILQNSSQVVSRGYGNLVLRADTAGNNDGTVILPPSGASIFMNGGGSVRIFYRAKDFTQPFNYSPLVRLTTPGTLISHMLINNLTDLQDINKNLSGTYALATNIETNGVLFSPIGTEAAPFQGRFDGQGYSIYNLRINLPAINNVGLFGYVNQYGTIQDVKLENVNVSGFNSVGGLVGYGGTASGAIIMVSSVSGNVSGNSMVAGLAGSYLYIDQTFTQGNLSVRGINGNGGGLVSGTDGDINNSYSTMTVLNASSSALFLGGLATNYGRLTNVYAAGTVAPSTYSGGIWGGQAGTAKNVFWDVQATGQPNPSGQATQVPGATGLLTSQMRQKSSYVNWDFDAIWGIEEGRGYPYLLWAKRTPPWTALPNNQIGHLQIVG